jgi:hypothetical protein
VESKQKGLLHGKKEEENSQVKNYNKTVPVLLNEGQW